MRHKRGKSAGQRSATEFLCCHYCPAPPTTWDHIVPKASGGSNERWNKVPSCFDCNQKKSDKMPTCKCHVCTSALDRWSDERSSSGVEWWEFPRQTDRWIRENNRKAQS